MLMEEDSKNNVILHTYVCKMYILLNLKNVKVFLRLTWVCSRKNYITMLLTLFMGRLSCTLFRAGGGADMPPL